MKKVISIILILILFGVIISLLILGFNLNKQETNIKQQLTEIETNIQINTNNEKEYNEKQKQLETLKNEKNETIEKYNEVNSWNQEIELYLN